MLYVVCVLRLMRFNDDWPVLQNWFDQFSVLKQVDASADHDDVTVAVENIIEQCLVKETPQVHTLTFTLMCIIV